MRKLLSVSIFVMVILALFVIRVLSSHNWDAKSFILLTPENLPLDQKWGIGYDGRFAYAIATNPWGSTKDLDQPAYRYQRILFPFLVRILGNGNSVVIPWVMIGVNFASTIILCWIFGILLIRRGQSPWLAIVFIFSLGYLLTIRMDLLEPLTFALALGGWLAYEEDKSLWAFMLFSLAGLTKEVGLLFPIALILWEFLRKNWLKVSQLFGCFLPYLIWFSFVNIWFGVSQEQIEKSRLLLIPFSGFTYLREPISIVIIGLWILLPASIFSGVAVWHLIREHNTLRSRDTLLLLCNSIFVLVMPGPSWVDPIAILRLGLGLLLGLLLWCSVFNSRLLPYVAGLYLPSAFVIFFVPGLF